jgi:hypothetical protein
MRGNRIRTGLTWVGLSAAVVVSLVIAAPASAGTKPYAVVFSPASVSAGTVTITAKITNENPKQQLGAANLTPPSGFTVGSATLPASSPGTAAVVGNVVQLRNLALGSGQPLPVTLSVTTPPGTCPNTTTYNWTVQAKQANNFNGAGNDFTFDAAHSSLTTTVTTACSLRFGTQPHNAVVNQHITGTDYNPSGSPVTVEIVDGNNNVVAASTASVTIAVAKNPGGATPGGTVTVSAVGGVATFSDLTLDKPDPGYTLKAGSSGLTDATSQSFDIQQTAVSCQENITCQTNLNNGTTSATVVAKFDPNNPDSGVLAESLDTGPPLVCAGYTPPGPDWMSFVMTATKRSKVVTLTVKTPPSLESPFGPDGDDNIQACFGAPYQFTTKTGTPAPLVTYSDGSTEYVGLLPDCSGAPTGPCVSGRRDDDSVPQTTALVSIPAGLAGDPRMH